MYELLRLIAHRSSKPRMPVTERTCGKTGYEIQVLSAIAVAHSGPSAFDQHDRIAAIGIEDVLRCNGLKIIGFHSVSFLAGSFASGIVPNDIIEARPPGGSEKRIRPVPQESFSTIKEQELRKRRMLVNAWEQSSEERF
jgi:hypothetical protein